MIVHAKRTQAAPMRAPASIDHACNRCAAGENDHVLLSLLDYHTKSPSPCQGGNCISFTLFFPGAGVCIFLLRRPLQGAGIRAAGRPGCAGANGLRPFRRLRRRACGPPCPLHRPAKATGSWCFPAGQAFRRFVFSHLPHNLRWNCSQALWYNLNEKTDRQAENLRRCLYDAPKGIDRSAGTGIPSVWLLHLFWEEI